MQFKLSSLLLGVSLLGLCLAMARLNLSLAMAVGVVSLLAKFRTWQGLAWRRQRGLETGFSDELALLASSLGTTVVIAVIVSFSFGLTLFAFATMGALLGEWQEQQKVEWTLFGFALGGVAGLFTANVAGAVSVHRLWFFGGDAPVEPLSN